MKRSVYILIFILTSLSINGYAQEKSRGYKSSADTTSGDSIEYELIIVDPGFNVWLMTKPYKYYYSEEYYEYKNRIYVDEWNYRYSTVGNNGDYDSYIDYDSRIDYGLDLNYRLYYYFKYFEEKHNTKLYPSFK